MFILENLLNKQKQFDWLNSLMFKPIQKYQKRSRIHKNTKGAFGKCKFLKRYETEGIL